MLAYRSSLSSCFSVWPLLSTKAFAENPRNISFSCDAYFVFNRDYEVSKILCILIMLRLCALWIFRRESRRIRVQGGQTEDPVVVHSRSQYRFISMGWGEVVGGL